MIEPWLQQKVAFGFIGAMLLTSSLGWLSWRNKKISSAEADSIAHTYTVINQLERTLEHVVDVETGARGFAATGEDQFLDPSNSAQLLLIQDLASLQRLTADDSKQMTWLAPLTNDIDLSVALSQKMVAHRRQGETDSLAAPFQQGKHLVDSIRESIHAQQAQQTLELTRRIHTTETKRRQADLITLSSTVVELSLLVSAWMTVRRALLMSARARAHVENSNIELEHRVSERTEQLSAKAHLLAKSSEALRTESRTLQSVLDNMEEGLAAADSKGQFTLWNRAA
ncbi:MAG: CHASE3 domain-containing protein, partial [Terriglobales bacterium]